MPDTPIIELQGVDVSFGSQAVLRNLTLPITRGETLAIIGESGCGKTCLLKLIVGLLQPIRGQVIVEGQSLSRVSQQTLQAIRQRIGFLFQGGALFDSLTAFENVAFPLRQLRSLREDAIRELVHDRLREVGLSDEVGPKMPAELSGGMRKRVGLARALALDPEIMLYDEPTTGLDPVMTERINELIRETSQRRPMTSILVTHEMKTVRRCAGRTVMLNPLAKLHPAETQILFDGPVVELEQSNEPRVRAFIS